MSFNQLASQTVIETARAALKANNIESFVVENGQAAKEKVLELLPKGAEVMTMTSVTLDTIGLSQEINESGSYDAVKPRLFAMDRTKDGLKMQKLGAAPEWSVGSVHAVTQQGQVVIASNTGSQLPGYAYGSQHVIWVVGTQKIVTDMNEAMARVHDYVLPLESERAHKAYGVPGSNISKMLIVNKEVIPGRITIVFVNEVLGF